MLRPDDYTDGQVSRLLTTDVPETLRTIITPELEPLHLYRAYIMYTMLSFIDFAGGLTSDRHVNMTTALWYDGTPLQVIGGIGAVEVYHR